jgi:Glutamine amidotransferase class-I
MESRLKWHLRGKVWRKEGRYRLSRQSRLLLFSRFLFAVSSTCSIFTGLPETFEVARYHSLHGIKEHLPKDLKVTALSEDGIVMGIQHASLPFAAVQFHPESILTSPAHGMAILKNALRYLKYDDDNLTPQSGAEIVGKLEQLTLEELRAKLADAGLTEAGSKSELVVRLALWTHKSTEARAGRLQLGALSTEELEKLKGSLMLSASSSSPEELLAALTSSLLKGVAQP